MILKSHVHAVIAARSSLVYDIYQTGKSWERVTLLSVTDLYVAESEGFTFGRGASGFFHVWESFRFFPWLMLMSA